MCSNADSPTGSAYQIKTSDRPAQPPATPATLLPLDQYRLQLYNYAMAERLRFSQLQHYPSPVPLCPAYPTPYGPRLALSMSLFHHRVLQPEEPKPQHSYIGLIAMAILSSPDHKLVLSDIYQHILDNYPYFRTRGPGWRNSIRHNLSLNDCFIKAGRSANGKGHYWAVHPANVEDFSKGDFRRRKAQRKVRKHMGLAVDDDGNDSPSPPPLSPPPPILPAFCNWAPNPVATAVYAPMPGMTRKRQFDVASLLAPDKAEDKPKRGNLSKTFANSSGEEDNVEEDIDVVASDQEDKEDSFDNATSPSKMETLPPISPTAQYPLLGGWGMFPGFGMDQNFITKYYEQLAAVQYQKRQQQNPTRVVNNLSPNSVDQSVDNISHSPSAEG